MRAKLVLGLGLCCVAVLAENGAPKTGYAQTVEYRDAVSSHRRGPVEEPLEARRIIEFSPYNRAYLRLRGSRVGMVFDHVQNDSDFAFLPVHALPSTTSVVKKQRQLSLAWGYLQDNIALELELYLPKGLEYVSDPALANDTSFTYPDSSNKGGFRYVARMKQVCLFSNLNYMLFNYNNVQPYLALGLGVTGKMYRITQSGTTTGLKNYALPHPAWNMGAGVAIQLSKHAGIDIGYRHMDLGHSKLHAAKKTDHLKLKSTSSRVHGYALGLFWRY